jgi:uncharacterized LabA/DUF88 family protein/cold shock CspA family protein
MASELIRIGIFYDGSFFDRVSRYYRYGHERRARISIEGLHYFIRHKVAELEGCQPELCQVVDAHYFRGRLSARTVHESNPEQLYYERVFDDVLMRAGVITHYLPMMESSSGDREKGIDVWLALEAFELTLYKKFEVVVLISGDGDLLPLVRKLGTLGTKVLLMAWDFTYTDSYGRRQVTTTAQSLIREAHYVLQMDQIIDSRSARSDPVVDGIFLAPAEPPAPREVADGPVGQTLRGRVKDLLPEKGIGFITGEDGDDYFMHVTYLAPGVEFESLEEGEEVVFEVGPRDPAYPRHPAKNVRRPTPEDTEEESPAEEPSEEGPAETEE